MAAKFHLDLLGTGFTGARHPHTRRNVTPFLDVLAGAYMVRILPPWFENISKRQVKSPKIYVRDSGIFHALLNLESAAEMRSHPKFGASWEGFAIEELLSTLEFAQPFFWATQRGAELDLLLERGGKRIGVEFKCSDAPGTTKSMHIALEELKLQQLLVVYPGTRVLPIHSKITIMPLAEASRAVAQHLESAPDGTPEGKHQHMASSTIRNRRKNQWREGTREGTRARGQVDRARNND